MGARARRRQRAGQQPKPDRKPDRPEASLALIDWPEHKPGAIAMRPYVRQPLVRLPDGSVGYCMRPDRPDDCFGAALATLLQVPVEQVPDMRLDDRWRAGEDVETVNREFWSRLAAWLDARGLEGFLHDEVPLARERWIGVCPPPTEAKLALARALLGSQPTGNPFAAHCIVMCRDRVLFDPAVSIKPPSGMRVAARTAADVKYGISIDHKEDKRSCP